MAGYKNIICFMFLTGILLVAGCINKDDETSPSWVCHDLSTSTCAQTTGCVSTQSGCEKLIVGKTCSDLSPSKYQCLKPSNTQINCYFDDSNQTCRNKVISDGGGGSGPGDSPSPAPPVVVGGHAAAPVVGGGGHAAAPVVFGGGHAAAPVVGGGGHAAAPVVGGGLLPPPPAGPCGGIGNDAQITIGRFTLECKGRNDHGAGHFGNIGSAVIRYWDNNNNHAPITREQFITFLTLGNDAAANQQDIDDGKDFRSLINKSIAILQPPAVIAANKNYYMLQAPIINHGSRNDPFYWVAIAARTNSQPVVGHVPDTYKYYTYYCPVTFLNQANTGHVYTNDPANHLSAYNYTFNQANLPVNHPFLHNDLRKKFWRLWGFSSNRSQAQINAGSPMMWKKGLQAMQPGQPSRYALPGNYGGAAILRGSFHNANDKLMVIPCPIHAVHNNGANDPIKHIYAFAQYLDTPPLTADKTNRLQAYYLAIGEALEYTFNNGAVRNLPTIAPNGALIPSPVDNTRSLKPNFHGRGQSHVHFRIDFTQDYYDDFPDLKISNQTARNFYNWLWQ